MLITTYRQRLTEKVYLIRKWHQIVILSYRNVAKNYTERMRLYLIHMEMYIKDMHYCEIV